MENRGDILRELKEIAPELSKVEKKNLIEVPANYFSSFPDKIMKRIRENELKEIAPVLSEHEKPDTPEVPANYFQSFPEQMLKKIAVRQKASSGLKWTSTWNELLDRVAGIIFKPRYTMAFAVTVSVIIIGLMFFLKTAEVTCAQGDLVCQLEKVSDEELDEYIYSNPDDFQKSVLDISTDDKKIQNQSDDINDELNTLLNELDDESLNNI